MGFLGVIPANKLAAVYNVKTKKLTLSAEGVVKGATYGFHFVRDTFMGGLKFTLEAWTGPLTSKDQPYTFQEAFSINLPMPHFESGSLIIVTANHPQGQVVPIHYLGLVNDVAGLKAAPAATKEADVPVTTVSPDSNQINVLFKMPFTIQANASVPKMGSVDVKYDTTVLELVNAGISDTDIIWTFNSLQTGDTQIVVTTSGGIATFISTKTYDVRIFVL
jgi:hypothetical protein